MATLVRHDPSDPCKYCAKPVGWGTHEQLCHENPENLARICVRPGCHAVGNHINSEYEWLCTLHNKLYIWTVRMQGRRGTPVYLKGRVQSLEKELTECRERLVRATEILTKEQREFDIFREWMKDYNGS